MATLCFTFACEQTHRLSVDIGNLRDVFDEYTYYVCAARMIFSQTEQVNGNIEILESLLQLNCLSCQLVCDDRPLPADEAHVLISFFDNYAIFCTHLFVIFKRHF